MPAAFACARAELGIAWDPPARVEHDEVDVLIVGAGLAGLVTALTTQRRHVTVLCPGSSPQTTASALAHGGIAAAVGEDDDPARHEEDTQRAAAGESSSQAVHRLCVDAPPAIRWLEGQGVRFARSAGHWALEREGAHTRARVLHVEAGTTGTSLTDTLYQAARAHRAVSFREGLTAVALTRSAGGVCGVVALDAAGRPVILHARETVLATGGIGQLYCRTTNPRSACGDGLAMALQVGARCTGLEFVQFCPAALAAYTDPLPILSEILWGARATLINERGVRFMLRAHPDAELAPRDVVAREVWRQLQVGERVYVDATRAFAAGSAALASVRTLCAAQGIDPGCQPIPIVPAAHYHMGGIAVDLDGRSSLPHLWACGEVACSGVHGANRLASNSLLEAVVFGRRLGKALSLAVRASSGRAGAIDVDVDPAGFTTEIHPHVWRTLRQLMWVCAGVEREAEALRTGLRTLEQLEHETPAQQILLHGRLRLARALMIAALARRKSLGAHVRTDSAPVSRLVLGRQA
jgi:L-aspartate oxidase